MPFAPGHRQGGLSIARTEHLKAGFLQVITGQLHNFRFVIYDEDALLHGGSLAEFRRYAGRKKWNTEDTEKAQRGTEF